MSPVHITALDMMSDTDTTKERAPRSIISKPADLSAEEKYLGTDILQAWCKDHRGFSEPLVMTDSGRTVAREPTLPKQTDDDIFIEVGTYSKVLSGEETVAEQSAGRAYLGLTINPSDRSITWSFKGEKGPIDPSLVHYDLYEDKASAYRACIANYDNSEIRRVETYNREYLLTLARRRVAHFSTTGTQPIPHIRPEDTPTKVEKIVLASMIFDQRPDSSCWCIPPFTRGLKNEAVYCNVENKPAPQFVALYFLVQSQTPPSQHHSPFLGRL
ncbi:hypothetical protein BHE90_008680 [Fusarium euwallaceae]|uniref:Uncharacterized protein n=1 Tax=Fusarium euwallaceae TaxID=1147111 RepID=A0A430LMA3_9HYPO|nr:hypothetical protein BHE90_008680 [Fusarium euwallaceae]